LVEFGLRFETPEEAGVDDEEAPIDVMAEDQDGDQQPKQAEVVSLDKFRK